jgi:hypothetical protein
MAKTGGFSSNPKANKVITNYFNEIMQNDKKISVPSKEE